MSEVQRYPDFEDHKGRVTSTLGLRFLAPNHFVNQAAKATCNVFLEGHEFSTEVLLQLDPSVAFHFFSSAGRSPSPPEATCSLSIAERQFLA